MRTLGFIFEYEGTNFSGWQIQPGERTVHGEIRLALQAMLRPDETPIVHCSGRTDAGVHARYQVAHFHTDSSLSLEKIRGGLTHFLPRDIALLGVSEMAETFHARHDSLAKTYHYRILNRRQRSALDRLRTWYFPLPLDVERMEEAAAHLVGRHDFLSFQGRRGEAKETVRTVFAVGFERMGDELIFRISGDGFLKQMVRNVVGTLVEVGQGRRKPEDMAEIIAACDRRVAGQTAPPEGLYLERVYYTEPHESVLRAGLSFRGEPCALATEADPFYDPHRL